MNQPEVTERELEIMKHAMGWPERYRNYFAAGVKDLETCESLARKRLMVYRNGSKTEVYHVYHVTQAGQEILKQKLGG